MGRDADTPVFDTRPSAEDRRSVRILHVDDDAGFRELTATYLEREDARFEVVSAGGASAGMDELVTGDCDCVVTDLEMPGRDGLEFLADVREAGFDIPVILFTGRGSEEIASRAISAGVSDYLRKRATTEQFTLLANRIRNLVERHRTEAELRESRRRLATLTSNLPGMVYRCRNRRGWPMEYVSDWCAELTGYDPSALLDGEVSYGGDVIHPEDRASTWETVQASIDDREPFDLTYRIVTAGGDVRWVWEQGRGVFEDGDLVALEGYISDVTEQKERERRIEALHESTRRLLTAESRAEAAQYTAQAAEETLEYHHTVVRLLDENGDALVPAALTDDLDQVIAEDRPTYAVGEETAGRAFAEGETVVYDDVRTVEDDVDRGEVRASMYVPIGDYGVATISHTEPAAFTPADVDVAEILMANAEAVFDRLKTEHEVERQNERLAKFVNVVSHDLRNPLSVAQSIVDELDADEERVARLDAVLDRMETIVENTLALARAGQGVVETESVDLYSLAYRCWLNSETGTASLDVADVGRIRADPDRLPHLFENLYRNAVEHAGDGVTVRIGALDDGFYVEDDGRGFPSPKRDEIDEAGFGLTIVTRVADAHGWRLDVGESPEGGARFEIRGVDIVERGHGAE